MVLFITLYLASCLSGFIGKRLLVSAGVFSAGTEIRNTNEETIINNRKLVILLDIMIFVCGIILFFIGLGIWMIVARKKDAFWKEQLR